MHILITKIKVSIKSIVLKRELKVEMKKLRDTIKKLYYKVRNISEELSNTFGIVFSRLVKIEEKQNKKRANQRV